VRADGLACEGEHRRLLLLRLLRGGELPGQRARAALAPGRGVGLGDALLQVHHEAVQVGVHLHARVHAPEPNQALTDTCGGQQC
jgi:hypothetical protein